MKAKKKTFRVWFHQINQSCVIVSAGSREEAIEKGRKQWRRDWGHPSLSEIEELPTDRRTGGEG